MSLAQGYEKLGFRREGNTVVYREWCPAATSAQLIGDFNGWGGTHMEHDGSGVWKAVLPDGDCLPACHPCISIVLVASKMPFSAGFPHAADPSSDLTPVTPRALHALQGTRPILRSPAWTLAWQEQGGLNMHSTAL